METTQNGDQEASTTTGGSGPGFTPVTIGLAVVGLVAALGIRRKGV